MTMERLQNASVIDSAGNAASALFETLRRMSWSNVDVKQDNVWRNSLCYLVYILNPRLKTYQIDESLPYAQKEFSKEDLLDTLANLGFFARPVELNSSDIDARLIPCLFVSAARPENPLILTAPDKAYDPASRKIVDFSGMSEGEAWFFLPYDEDKTRTSRAVRSMTGESWFRLLLSRFHNTFAQIIVSGLFLNLIALSTPLFIMVVYDKVIAPQSFDTMPMLAVGLVLAIAVEWVLRSLRSRHLSWLAGRLDNIVSNKIFSHLLKLSPYYIERASVPSQVARLKTFEAVRDFFSSSVFLSMMELPFAVVAAIAIAAIAGPLVIVPIVMVVFYAALFMTIWSKIKVAIRISAKASSTRQQFMMETIDKLEDINANGLSNAWAEKFQDVSAREAVTSFQLAWLGVLGETLANALTVISAVAVVGFGVDMIWTGAMSTGALVATMILVWRILTPFYSLCTMIPRLDQLRNSIRQVNELVEIKTEEEEHKASARLNRIKGRISFVSVGMKYDESIDPLFSGLTFEVMPGDIVAITGSNGSGKTTLLKMIKGMYNPQSGSIRIDGFDIRQLNPLDLRRRIAYIPQNTSFYKGTIADNLRLANPLATDRDLREALARADALEEVNALPQGLETIIGGGASDHNIHISSSLELRLAMVRAYIHEAPILLIDELPNSLLSDEAGHFMHDYLLHNKKNRTVVMVTHREDFMQAADTIVVLRGSQQPMVGPRQFILDQLHKDQW